ncbi:MULTISPECIES: diacylglycerol kinase [unclassified Candidatus Pelagibacter]|uniref:diacylglycerol kinase n=1 Tax=unclassified Candidatus Pelagibacter TaxID=2647897 RepID=UPI003F8474BD
MITKLYKNLINSLNGLKIVINEKSFLMELILGLFLIPYIFLSNIEFNHKLFLFVLYFLLLATEVINTAIEKLSDKITKNYDSDIKNIKDLSSASVFLILLILIITFFITI